MDVVTGTVTFYVAVAVAVVVVAAVGVDDVVDAA